MEETHRNTEGAVLSFFTFGLLAEIRELHQAPASQTPVLGSDSSVSARFLPREIPDRPGDLLMVSLDGAVRPTKYCVSSITGTLGAKVGKALGQGLLRYPHS